jgi:acetoacetyl-CoA synthetase
VLAPDVTLDDALRKRINDALRRALSPRHTADRIFAVPEIPKTLNGKKLEIPVKRLLMDQPLAGAVSEGAVANPASLGAVLQAYREATAARS